ncbi:MAG TPA: FHA domain-containing protein [Myxococcaceae bacterium]|nr:FHA domain-containing protein [Myxococcaceae bacterium]
MSVRLTVKQRHEAGGADKGTEVVLEDEIITLGRDKSCQVVLAEQAVSRNHARISRDGALFFIEDLGSAYGTQINGKKLPKGEKRLLRDGDVIAIAQFDVTFDRIRDLAPSSEKTSFMARQLVKDVMRGMGGEGPFFRYMNGPSEGKRVELSEAMELIIGRDPTADIVLDDDLVSRRHAKIRRDWSGTHVEDLDSRNGIKVNKKRVNRRTLKDKDELQVGNARLLYLDPSEVREEEQEEPLGEMTDPPLPAEPEPAPEQAAAEEPPPAEEPPAEEPVEEPPAEEPPAEEPAEPAADEEPAEDDEELAAPNPKARAIAVVTMGLFALVAVGLIIAILAGA